MDHYKPGRYLAVTGEGKSYWFDFPNSNHEPFKIIGDKVIIDDGLRPEKPEVCAEWYFLNECLLYHTLTVCIPIEQISEATELKCNVSASPKPNNRTSQPANLSRSVG